MRLILNEGGKPYIIETVFEIEREDIEGKANIHIRLKGYQYHIRIDLEAATILINTFLTNNDFRVEKSCFEKWTKNYALWIADYRERHEVEKW